MYNTWQSVGLNAAFQPVFELSMSTAEYVVYFVHRFYGSQCIDAVM